MSEPKRPSPEEFLARARAEEERLHRAKLKIFFGASAGVGKTYAMLVEAHERKRAGTDVVAGLVETHGRRETGALLEGLETLPRRSIEYRGTHLREFDLDAALIRKPGLILLDELAHTNVPGSRHRKRWQDVEELLGAGIDVYTTLNVQHVESLLDVVTDITGVTVRESVPDSILERADEIELIDLPPDDLLQRLREGKVYVPEQAEWARENFFRKPTLIALRELALRQTAQRVDAQMEFYRQTEGIREPWAVGERMLVCVGDPARGVRLVRAARRLAGSLRADWIVVHVETPGQLLETRKDRDYLIGVLDFAFELGAETQVLSGLRVRDEILAFARARNVTRVVVGQSLRPRWMHLLRPSLATELMRGEVDVWVTRGEEEYDQTEPEEAPSRPMEWRGYPGMLLVVALCTLTAEFMYHTFDRSNIAMVYLVGVVVTAMAFGRGPAIVASILGVASFDFFFVDPRYTFAVSDTEYLVTFGVMLLVAMVIGTLTSRLREQLAVARREQQSTASQYRLSHELAARGSLREILGAAVDRVAEILKARVAILVPDGNGRLGVASGDGSLFGGGEHERAVAQWAFENRRAAGLGTSTLSGSRALHLPLNGASRTLGVLAVMPEDLSQLRDPDTLRFIDALANQTAVAVERSSLAESAERARMEIETERARSALLSSVSHDLRTPLAAITGAATSLLESATELPGATARDLVQTIADEAGRLNRLIGDLLEMTRLESGHLRVQKEWHSLEEVVGGALGGLEGILGSRPVTVSIPADLPLVALDDVLFGQVVRNLVENACKYSPPDQPIEITGRVDDKRLRLVVEDWGPGLRPGEERRVFEKFYRGADWTDREGVGLGLAISKSIVEAHGGQIHAANRPRGGASFTVLLPLEGDPPSMERALSEDGRSEGT
jgi:two-component system, OmpR family, sensor histidine kinase KdpD